MAAGIPDRVREIAEVRGLPESGVFEQALERGLEDLWEDLVLAQCPNGELDREEAIEHVGQTKVERAEREREVVEEDVDWGLNAWRLGCLGYRTAGSPRQNRLARTARDV